MQSIQKNENLAYYIFRQLRDTRFSSPRERESTLDYFQDHIITRNGVLKLKAGCKKTGYELTFAKLFWPHLLV
jgi:hypothetical protein